MIQINKKEDCCGCESCVQTCPKQCISFEEDNEGFRYPKVLRDLCVDCGLCEKVCPILNQNEPISNADLFAAQNQNEDERRLSSSGGVFVMLAKKIIRQKGIVFGASFNEHWEVSMDCSDTEKGVKPFMGSKYVQCRIGNNYIKVRDYLKDGKKVLFCGTPCQVRGLKLFLRKEYENLITVDFVCHGVPSPGLFRWYLQEEMNKYAQSASNNTVSFPPIHSIPKGNLIMPHGIEIKGIRFRDKREGWKKYSFVLHLAKSTDEGKKNSVFLSTNVIENTWLIGFTSNLYLRPSCHSCPTRNFKSGSDITIADFWGQEYTFPEFDNNTGVSAVFLKTLKGKELFVGLNGIKVESKDINQFISYNSSLIESRPRPYRSKKFWRLSDKYSFEERVNKARSLNLIERVYMKLFNK